ncbi:hypothetical protein P7D15_01345 [Bacillus cereus]|uniref:hypothetical protein n=1 Tax=Bacillus cereus TaxID=1396 RepID=UPI0024053DA3|nr:hypothetical protein [Bacillus cereus]MDF9599059.1 hypothetical protein [Bacillus cereus]MDG1589392.1 hypothetical protein [Bacillus cereus]
MFRVVYKKTLKSKLEIKEGLTMLQMGEYLNTKENYHEMKIYQFVNGMYANPLAYKNGKLVKGEEVEKSVQTPPSIVELFDALQKVPPSRQGNPIQLLYDLTTGEDITKPKLKAVDDAKD